MRGISPFRCSRFPQPALILLRMSTLSPDLPLAYVGGRHHFLLRRLHSLTGVIFGGYLVVHLIVNATIAQLGSYQVQVNKIHDLPMLWAVEWIFIFIPILYH